MSMLGNNKLFIHYSNKSTRKLPHFKLKASSSSESGSSVFPEEGQTARNLSESLVPDDGTKQVFRQKNQEKDFMVASAYGMA